MLYFNKYPSHLHTVHGMVAVSDSCFRSKVFRSDLTVTVCTVPHKPCSCKVQSMSCAAPGCDKLDGSSVPQPNASLLLMVCGWMCFVLTHASSWGQCLDSIALLPWATAIPLAKSTMFPRNLNFYEFSFKRLSRMRFLRHSNVCWRDTFYLQLF